MTAQNKDQGLTIRPPDERDAADLHAIASDPQVARWMVQLPTMELSRTESWLAGEQTGRHRLVAEKDGRVVGSCNLRHYQNPRVRHAGRVGLMVHRDYWNQGVGSALMAGALELADNWLNLMRVELEVMSENHSAIRLYEKFGFEVEGLRRCAVFGDGSWQDELQMARLRNTNGLTPSRLLPDAMSPGEQRPLMDVSIRSFRKEDIPDLHRVFREPFVGRTTMQLPSLELSQLRRRLQDNSPSIYRLVAVADDTAVGLISLHRDDNPRMNHSAGLGMMVHPSYWGLGIGTRLMEGILDIADNWLALKRVDLEVNTDNPAGVRLYEKFGFRIEGTKRFHIYGAGRWADSYFMARLHPGQV